MEVTWAGGVLAGISPPEQLVSEIDKNNIRRQMKK
jgi:hypothetical protein